MWRSILCNVIELEELHRVVYIGLQGFVVNRFQQTLNGTDWAEKRADFSNLPAVHYPLLGDNSLNPNFPTVLHVQILRHVYSSSHAASQVTIGVHQKKS